MKKTDDFHKISVFFLSISKEGNNNSCDKESRSFNLSPEREIFFPFPVPKR